MILQQVDGSGQGANGLRPFPVIVRAFQDEPVMMEAVGVGPGFFIVRQPGGAAELQLPSKDVYEFDEARYLALRDAFTTGDGMALVSLWYVTPRA